MAAGPPPSSGEAQGTRARASDAPDGPRAAEPDSDVGRRDEDRGDDFRRRDAAHGAFDMEEEDDDNGEDDDLCDRVTHSSAADGAFDVAEDGDDGDDGAADGAFDVEEDDDRDGPDDDFGDGFHLFTQSNELFTQTSDGDASVGVGDESGDESGGGSDDDESPSSSCESPAAARDDTPLQERRARNLRRNALFTETLKADLAARYGGLGGAREEAATAARPRKETRRRAADAPPGTTGAAAGGDGVAAGRGGGPPHKRRGMTFVDTVQGGPCDAPASASRLTATSLADELAAQYPHRARPIRVLCSQLVNFVQRSQLAWQTRDAASGDGRGSAASYQGCANVASPAPILVTGPGGSGKTRVVRDALAALQRRAGRGGAPHPAVAAAYVECAASDAGSLAAAMNDAYRQLHEGFGRRDPVGTKRGAEEMAPDALDEGDVAADLEEEAVEDTANFEDAVERQRQRSSGKPRGTKTSKKPAKAHSRTRAQPSGPHTRLRASLDARPVCPPSADKPSIHANAHKNALSGSSVSLFGRAASALLHGAAARARASSGPGRCAFVVLDNAERLLSWKKKDAGALSPLAQLCLLPGVVGLHLTLILISRSTLFQYSPVHKAPATLVDAVHPLKIHFSSYTTVEQIKSILQVPRIKMSIIGRSTNHVFSCAIANKLRSNLNDLMYTSMINSFIPSVKSFTQDITELARLARLLWPEYVAPLDTSNSCRDSELHSELRLLVWQVLRGLRRGSALSKDHCDDFNCSFCKRLMSETDGDKCSLDSNILRLSEKLDRNVRNDMRTLLSSIVMMSGRSLLKHHAEPFAKRLPYVTKFLLIAAFLCQHKRPEQDVNLFTTTNTGKARRERAKESDNGVEFASSSKELRRRPTSFPLERLLSVFHSIIMQYGNHFMSYKEVGASTVAQLGTERLLQAVSQLIASGLLSSVTSTAKFKHDLMEMTSAKFSCMISRDTACILGSDVGFPLEKYCP